jgi:hypothetical protein
LLREIASQITAIDKRKEGEEEKGGSVGEKKSDKKCLVQNID